MAGMIDLVGRGEIAARLDRVVRPPRRPAGAERLRGGGDVSLETERPSAVELAVLDGVQKRVLWLAAAIVHHANHVRPEPLGREGRRPPGVERLDGVADDRAVVRVPRGARPCLGQAARVAGAARDQLPARPARAALPGDAAAVRRAAVVPVARQGSGPGRLLHRLGRHRRDGADLGRARAPLRGRPLRRAGRRPPDRAARRRRARRGRVLGGDRRPDGGAARRGAVGRRPQPPVARPRGARHRGGPARVDVRGSRLALRDGQVRAEARRARGAAGAGRRDAQRGVPAAAARGRGRAAAAPRGDRRRPRGRRAAAHVPRPRRPRPRRAARRLPPGRRGARPARASCSRTRSRAGGCRPRATRRTTPRCSTASSTRSWRTALGADPEDPWATFDDGLAGGRAVRERGAARSARPPRPPAAASPRVPGRPRPRAQGHAPRPSRRSGASSSTSCARRPRWPSAWSRSRPTSAPRPTSAAGSTRPASGTPGDRIDWFADDTDTLVRWRETDHGRHIELGIAEVNLVGLLGELGATWSRDGQPLLPVGTIYDPFVARALEPWSFGIYAGGQSILVGTPSGVTLGPEGGAHQSVITPSIGIEQPGCTFWEPAFGQDLEWAFLHALSRLGREDGEAAYFRLSTRPIDQSLAGGTREEVLSGGYRLRAGRRPARGDRGHGRARAGGGRGRRHRCARRPTPRPRSSASRAPTCSTAPSRPAPASPTPTRPCSTGCSRTTHR